MHWIGEATYARALAGLDSPGGTATRAGAHARPLHAEHLTCQGPYRVQPTVGIYPGSHTHCLLPDLGGVGTLAECQGKTRLSRKPPCPGRLDRSLCCRGHDDRSRASAKPPDSLRRRASVSIFHPGLFRLRRLQGCHVPRSRASVRRQEHTTRDFTDGVAVHKREMGPRARVRGCSCAGFLVFPASQLPGFPASRLPGFPASRP